MELNNNLCDCVDCLEKNLNKMEQPRWCKMDHPIVCNLDDWSKIHNSITFKYYGSTLCKIKLKLILLAWYACHLQ